MTAFPLLVWSRGKSRSMWPSAIMSFMIAMATICPHCKVNINTSSRKCPATALPPMTSWLIRWNSAIALFIVLDTFGFMDGNRNWDNGIDELQYWWFYATALQSQAKHKFVLTHGPAYSTEGWPVGNPPVRDLLWQTMKDTTVLTCTCAATNTFMPAGNRTAASRRSSAVPPGPRPMIPRSSSPSPESVYPIRAAWDYIFTVVDVQGD